MPNPWSITFLLFLLCASAGAGYFVKSRLPERHRSRDSIELVQLSVNLLATFTAIVLGLLTTSVKAGFDAAYTARGTYAAELAQMDQCLREYGAETAPIREQLRELCRGGHRQHLAGRKAAYRTSAIRTPPKCRSQAKAMFWGRS